MEDDVKKELAPIPKGAVFYVSAGEYSDYNVMGVFRVLKTINVAALARQWVQDHPEQTGYYKFKEYEFLAWVHELGLCEQIDTFEWHMTDYSSISEMECTSQKRKE